jgi:hypothetical protein
MLARALRRLGVASTLAVAGALALPAAVLAAPASVSLANGALTVRAAPGTADRIVLKSVVTARAFPPGAVVSNVEVASPQGVRASGPPCTSASQRVVRCPSDAVRSILVDLGDRRNLLIAAGLAPFPTTVQGGPGPDRITGGAGPDRIIGGLGRDFVRGGPGNDTLDMRDHTRGRLRPGLRDGLFDCGPGDGDTGIADRMDLSLVECERIIRIPPPSDTRAPVTHG